MILVSVLLLTGCRSVETAAEPHASFSRPPDSLSEFFKSPIDGVYSVPESAASERDLLSHNIIVIAGGVIRLSRYHNGRISTNEWDFVEFRPTLPTEDTFHRISAGTTESEIISQFGKPTRVGFDYYPLIGLKSGSTKHVTYSWFTVSESSQFTFFLLHVSYLKSKDGDWRVESTNWEKWGGRTFSSNKSVETNRRPAIPLDAGRQFGSASCALPALSAAVAHLYRSAI